ncbi:MAG: N-acetylmuramoyl-L-alanine amidase [Saprospiraceae bacterium]
MASFLLHIIFATLFYASPYSSDIAYTYHSVSLKKGDGMWSLLRRYNLNHSECNIDQFYELNGLEKNSYLNIGTKYKLPVYIYNYDGKSIRSTIGIQDWDKAVRIKEYNEYLISQGLRKHNYKESKILWVPHNEIQCKQTNKPLKNKVKDKESLDTKPAIRIIKNDLYGKGYSNVKVFDNSLNGIVFYVISGHGGIDPGAVCDDFDEKLCEDEYAYDVALRLARNLVQHGATVEMVIIDEDGIRDEKYLKCDTDEKLANGKKVPASQRKRLKQRTVYVNNKYAEYKKKGMVDQYVVSIHVDSRKADHRQDVFFCHYKESKSGKKLATSLQKKFQEKYDKYQKNRGYHGHLDERSLYVLMNTAPPATLIELANIKNKSDHRRILIKENRQALANWIYEGLSDHAIAESQEHVATP